MKPRRWLAAGLLITSLLTLPSLAGAGEFKTRLLQAMAVDDLDQILAVIAEMKKDDSREVAELLIRYAIDYDDILVHREALTVLSELKNKEAQDVVLEAAVKSREWGVRATCVRILSRYPGEFSYDLLKKALDDKQWQVRSAAIRALVEHRRRETIDLLIGRLKSESERLKWDLKWSLERLTAMQLEADHGAWLGWWTQTKDTFQMPTLQEATEKLAAVPEEKDVHTAVRDGLYGPLYSEKVAFLFDVSGSMSVGTESQGTRIEIAKSEIIKVLENQLSKNSYFNIIVFAQEVASFRPGLQKAKKKTAEKAIEFVQQLRAGGETNAFDALKLAFEDPNVDTIYLLSDGQPTVGEETIPELIHQKVATWNRNRSVVINCIGFFPGSAKNQDKEQARGFLRKLALENEGFYLEIY